MRAGALAALSSRATVLGLIVGYLALHLAVRLLTSPTLGIDDGEQALLAQKWAWGYAVRQPPLYTWLLLPVIDLVGVNRLALGLVRYLLLAVTYLCLYQVARRWIADRRLAALAVLSFASIYMFGYYAHHDLTHSTALAAACAASFYAFARLVERPSAGRYLFLGLCFGLGMLAKWNFVMLAAGLPLTCLLHARFRALVLSPKLLLALAAMALVVAPTALWLFGQEQSIGGTAAGVLAERPHPGFWATLAAGTGTLAAAALVYPLPFLILFLLAFESALRRALRGAGAPAAWTTDRPQVTVEFLATLIAVILALYWLLIPTVGATAFTEHWMHPALMILPIMLFALLERGQPTPRALRGFAALLGLVVVIALGARIQRYLQGGEDCGRCREFAPFAELARQLRAIGFERGTIVADGAHLGGNLRVAFPDSRVIDPAFPLSSWPPPTDHGGCLAVWRAGDAGSATRERRAMAYLREALQIPPETEHVTATVAAPLIRSTTRSYVLGYALWAEGSGDCR
jgi:4-amino-4-deoxy-L-arabinose transferase-like glycosyltransferase